MNGVLQTIKKTFPLIRRHINTSVMSQVTTILKLSEPEPSLSEIQSASWSLVNGFIIAVPTDTIYGIAGLAQNTDAVNKIYNIKERNHNNPIAISVATIDDIYKWSKVTVPRELLADLLPGPVTVVMERWSKVTVPRELLADLLPGPVTVVMERSEELNPAFNPGTRLVGIRIPDHHFIQEIAKWCNGPIALTSANISATRSTLNIQEFENLWPHLTTVCDGGQLGDTEFSRRGSTVVDLSVSGKYKILREGSAKKTTVAALTKYNLTEDT